MLFNSLHYAIFLPAVFALYHWVPQKWRPHLLLVSSYIFYASWKPEYLGLILLSTGIDYFAALKMPSSTRAIKKLLLGLSVLTNLGLLFAFKYFNFFGQAFFDVLSDTGYIQGFSPLNVLLPVGISFYTFQSMSYTIDVYREKISPEKSFSRLALFVAFFPQLVAGPIERASKLIPQFINPHAPTVERLSSGGRRILWGLFKKLVVAGYLSSYVDYVFANPADYYGLSLLLAGYFFAWQIYCDFSAYSDIAIGSAKLFGIDLSENFRRPFLATNMREFNGRWHMTLFAWFRDYIYYPLGGRRQSRGARVYFNLFIVFMASGLWHGAGWTFILWGFLHWALTFFERVTGLYQRSSSKFLRVARVFVTFQVITLTAILFRSESIHKFWIYLKNLLVFDTELPQLAVFSLPIGVGIISLMLGLEVYSEKHQRHKEPLLLWPKFIRWLFYGATLALIIVLGRFGSQPFIYFQF